MNFQKHIAIRPKYSKSYDFQTTTHKEPHTVQGQDKHWLARVNNKDGIDIALKILNSDWLLRHHVIFFCALKVKEPKPKQTNRPTKTRRERKPFSLIVCGTSL